MYIFSGIELYLFYESASCFVCRSAATYYKVQHTEFISLNVNKAIDVHVNLDFQRWMFSSL